MKSMRTEVIDHLFCPCRPSKPHSMNLKHPLNKKEGHCGKGLLRDTKEIQRHRIVVRGQFCEF